MAHTAADDDAAGDREAIWMGEGWTSMADGMRRGIDRCEVVDGKVKWSSSGLGEGGQL